MEIEEIARRNIETYRHEVLMEIEEIARRNIETYRQEAELALALLQQDRHRSIPPYEWFGPDPEPTPAGKDCSCGGCVARFTMSWDGR